MILTILTKLVFVTHEVKIEVHSSFFGPSASKNHSSGDTEPLQFTCTRITSGRDQEQQEDEILEASLAVQPQPHRLSDLDLQREYIGCPWAEPVANQDAIVLPSNQEFIMNDEFITTAEF